MIYCHANKEMVSKETAQCREYGDWVSAEFIRLKAPSVCLGCPHEWHKCPSCGNEVSYNHKTDECAAGEYKVHIKKFKVTLALSEGAEFNIEVNGTSAEDVIEMLENVLSAERVVKVEEIPQTER